MIRAACVCHCGSHVQASDKLVVFQDTTAPSDSTGDATPLPLFVTWLMEKIGVSGRFNVKTTPSLRGARLDPTFLDSQIQYLPKFRVLQRTPHDQIMIDLQLFRERMFCP
mmetsp:Transcript_17193/g.32081  ORF Transcript_17193/g.32081 Transcript_17193/m.32081 type:complete len:110 (-) Transcript_17193:241-570(-)